MKNLLSLGRGVAVGRVRLFLTSALFAMAVATASVAWMGCGGGGLGGGNASCPTPPAATQDHGPVAQHSPTTSLTIALSALYMRERIMAQMETSLPARASKAALAIPEGSPGAIPTGGVDVQTVRHEQRQVAGQMVNLILMDIVPWLRTETIDPADPTGQTMVLGRASITTRPFNLRLRLVPHLITPTTVTDRARRQRILACDPLDQTCAGAVLSFAFFELYDNPNGKVVACDGSPQSAPPDIISGPVLKGVLETVSKQAPLRLPTAGLLSMIASMTGAQADLIGMSLGTDSDLKIGLLLNQGEPFPFDPFAGFRSSGEDWAVVIDKKFINNQVDATLAEGGRISTPTVAFNLPASVDFRQGGLDVSASGSATTVAFGCMVPVSVSVSISVSACTKSSGAKVLRMCRAAPQATPQNTACAIFEQLFSVFVMPTGLATATVSCPTCSCVDTPIAIEASPGDTFYPTKVDTNNVFELSGRSTFSDTKRHRPPAPPPCQ